jgi:hypothetical protein
MGAVSISICIHNHSAAFLSVKIIIVNTSQQHRIYLQLAILHIITWSVTNKAPAPHLPTPDRLNLSSNSSILLAIPSPSSSTPNLSRTHTKSRSCCVPA